MASRYGGRGLIFNDNEEYKKKFFNDRDINRAVQYDTAEFLFPTTDQIAELENIKIRWGATSKLYNLAAQHYGNPTYWWVIALYNKKPTEADFKIGEIVYIPLPLEEILEHFGV
tara:strand:+ start:2498 stop:2839 length:342 start_codon:yes stop_codon:yes gene_type:complete